MNVDRNQLSERHGQGRVGFGAARHPLQQVGSGSNPFDAKADVIAERDVGVYFDHPPEMLKNVADKVHVFLYRNGGNFDFDERRWMLSERTGRLV